MMGVYFIRRPSNGQIKIGASFNVQGRMYDLRVKCREQLELLAVYDRGNCPHRNEARFHAKFEPQHVGGEWFEPTDAMLAIIDEVARGVFLSDALPDRGWCVTKSFQTKASIRHWGVLPRAERLSA